MRILSGGFYCFASIVLFAFCAYSQKVIMNERCVSDYKAAYDNYMSGNYSSSLEGFSDFLSRYPQEDNPFSEQAFFYRAAASHALTNADADVLLSDFIRQYPQSPYLNKASFLLADFYSDAKKFEQALAVYRGMNASALEGESWYEYHYKYGHCLFLNGNYDEAVTELDKVREAKSRYAASASYFHAHIMYEQQQYEPALKEFLDLQQDKNFGKIVPYYIAQIYYYRGNYEELIEIAPSLSEKSQSKRSGELNRMLGDAYYKLGRYKEAIPYLEKAVQQESADAQDYYLLGYTLLEEKEYAKAKPYLLKATDNRDSLAQNAFYHLGICCLELGEKQNAQAMFKEAWEMDFDKAVQEKALLNYAKVSYETAPAYNESVKAFQAFADMFPNSDKADEAKEYLAQLYGNMKNYRDAVEMLEQMSERSLSANKAYQRLCLNRAIEVFNEGRAEDALIYLDKSLSQAHDNVLTATAYYMKAEAYYQMGEYDLSVQNLNAFYASAGAAKSPYLAQADYTMGYNLFKQKKYSTAKNYFQRTIGKLDAKQSEDAVLRYADCLYMCKDFDSAIEQYGKIVEKQHSDADYASYQTAMAYGALGNYERKKEVLERAYENYNKGNYAATIKYELANTYLTLEENRKAMDTYQNVITLYPQSLHVKDCYAKIGMIHYKLGEDAKALDYLDKLVRTYPESEEARAALANIKAIYVSANKVDDYLAYTEKLPTARVSAGDRDSISYQAAENLYMEGDCANAIIGFEQYLSKYPKGIFFVNADYYLADCLNKSGKKTEALKHYEAVIENPKNVFTEKSLLKAAELNLEAKNYEKAEQQYNRLEAIAEVSTHKLLASDGQMQCCFHLSKFDSATMYANKLLSLEKVDETVKERATYILAKSLLANRNSGQAIVELKRLSQAKNPEYAGEAQYTLAELSFLAGDTEGAEKMIHQINANPSSEYWLAKTFVLWADIFKSKGNVLQAKQTLQSIVDNYDGDEELIETAKQKLLQLTEEQDKTRKENETKRMEHNAAVDEVIIEEQEQ